MVSVKIFSKIPVQIPVFLISVPSPGKDPLRKDFSKFAKIPKDRLIQIFNQTNWLRYEHTT